MKMVGDPTELWRQIGKTLWMVQLVEYGLVHFTVATRLPEKISKSEMLDLFEKQFKPSVGVLLGNLRQAGLIPPKTDAALSNFVDERNWLAHSIRILHGNDIHDAAAYSVLISRLERLQTDSLSISKAVADWLEQWAKSRGVSQEELRRETERLMSEAPRAEERGQI